MRLAAIVDLAYGIQSKIALARLLSNFLAAAPTAAGISDIVSNEGEECNRETKQCKEPTVCVNT